MSLFSGEPIVVPLPKAECQYYPSFLNTKESAELFSFLKNEVNWSQGEIKIFGKTYLEPRLVAWFGEYAYGYSSVSFKANPMLKPILEVKEKIEHITKAKFNGVLINYYRNGQDSMGWHSDNEANLGPDPVIASLNLGQTRSFHLKPRGQKAKSTKILLENGSLLFMGKGTQIHYQHQVPKSKTQVGERINLTFRYLV
jgi:alkylated DNA repair dioxygenase AlkB